MATPLISSRPPRRRDGALSAPSCPNCGSALSIHQPDEELPNRLLATCNCCKSWFLTDGSGALGPVVVVTEDD